MMLWDQLIYSVRVETICKILLTCELSRLIAGLGRETCRVDPGVFALQSDDKILSRRNLGYAAPIEFEPVAACDARNRVERALVRVPIVGIVRSEIVFDTAVEQRQDGF